MARRSPPSFIRVSTGRHTFSIVVRGRHVGIVADAATPEEALAAWQNVWGSQAGIEAKLQTTSDQPRQDFQTPPSQEGS